MVGWNLVIFNLAHSPHHLWCWPWIGAWAAIVFMHGIIVFTRPNRAVHKEATSDPTRVAPAHSSR